MSPHPQGTVVRAWIDGQGDEPDWKIRPAVILGYEAATERYFVAVGTSKLDHADPLKIPITSGRRGERITGLKLETAVNCGWRRPLDREDIVEVAGTLPQTELTRIVNKVRELIQLGKKAKSD